jgi:hypothetical protein
MGELDWYIYNETEKEMRAVAEAYTAHWYGSCKNDCVWCREGIDTVPE